MILYCDTSALIKLYLREEHSELMLECASSAKLLAVCRIAWAEAMSALARRVREVAADAPVIEEAKQRMRQQWSQFAVVEVTQVLVEQAGEHADTFALRGYDSIQLAAANTLHASAGNAVTFACFDRRLSKAAQVLGMATLDTRVGP